VHALPALPQSLPVMHSTQTSFIVHFGRIVGQSVSISHSTQVSFVVSQTFASAFLQSLPLRHSTHSIVVVSHTARAPLQSASLPQLGTHMNDV
jgi:hypothetical protein